jgi:hypothetical protein
VLLVGANPKGFSFIQKRLENRGCQCIFALAGAEAARILEQNSFDLVLCVNRAREIQALTASMIGSPGSLYCSYLLDDGCLWLPAVQHGVRCLGAPAMGPSEFANALDGIVREVRAHAQESLEVGTAVNPA